MLRSRPVGVIVLAQLFGTSLWFSPNSAAPDLIRAWHLTAAALGHLTSAVQVGFIFFAFFNECLDCLYCFGGADGFQTIHHISFLVVV